MHDEFLNNNYNTTLLNFNPFSWNGLFSDNVSMCTKYK